MTQRHGGPRDPFGDIVKVAEALDVPPKSLLAGIVGGLVLLFIAVATKSTAVGIAAAGVGVGFVVLGIRAIVQPARPFGLESSGAPYINNSRRVGAFYVLAGLIWILIGLAAPHTS